VGKQRVEEKLVYNEKKICFFNIPERKKRPKVAAFSTNFKNSSVNFESKS